MRKYSLDETARRGTDPEGEVEKTLQDPRRRKVLNEGNERLEMQRAADAPGPHDRGKRAGRERRMQ